MRERGKDKKVREEEEEEEEERKGRGGGKNVEATSEKAFFPRCSYGLLSNTPLDGQSWGLPRSHVPTYRNQSLNKIR